MVAETLVETLDETPDVTLVETLPETPVETLGETLVDIVMGAETTVTVRIIVKHDHHRISIMGKTGFSYLRKFRKSAKLRLKCHVFLFCFVLFDLVYGLVVDVAHIEAEVGVI